MSTHDRIAFFARVASILSQAKAGSVLPVDEGDVLEILPHFWREEADTIEEWFIRYCRAYGLHATCDRPGRLYHVCLTRDAEHEATISWPGKSHA